MNQEASNAARLEPFCKLADPARYLACVSDFSTHPESRDHWVTFFRKHFETILKLGIDAARARGEGPESAEARADSARREFHRIIDAYMAHPDAHGRVTLLTLDAWRDDTLRAHGFYDAFIDLKNRDNEKALPFLPSLCRELDSLSGIEQFTAVIQGVFAGNIFDMGAPATAHAVMGGSHDFHESRLAIRPRPWLFDDFDALARRMLHGAPHHKAVFFIDNAGSDFLLGALPMIRWLAQRGTQVVLAANELPTLNDMTVADVQAWWPRILQTEPSLSKLPIHHVSTGSGNPLLDLNKVSPQLNAASADADLVILEGMGRGVESNLEAEFCCEALNLAMIKDEMVARQRGGKVFDVVCRFR
ncbi:MAG TPA: ARMT1-like domain-containing protein [Tepidisphaeraceae bacterium]|nr:ARMT1-like domain-containing protein [Tepidisphaeraceae bacterium]